MRGIFGYPIVLSKEFFQDFPGFFCERRKFPRAAIYERKTAYDIFGKGEVAADFRPSDNGNCESTEGWRVAGRRWRPCAREAEMDGADSGIRVPPDPGAVIPAIAGMAGSRNNSASARHIP